MTNFLLCLHNENSSKCDSVTVTDPDLLEGDFVTVIAILTILIHILFYDLW